MYGLPELGNHIENVETKIPMRSAGVLFLVLGLINLFNEAYQPVHAIITTSNFAYLLCLLIGTLLLLGVKSVVPFARFVIVTGALLQGGYLVMHGLFLDLTLQLILCAGLWMVLSPRSLEFRILYLSGFLSVTLVLGVDLLILSQRFESKGYLVNAYKGAEPTTVDTVFGNAYAYRLDFGKEIWHLRNPKFYKKNNPATDLWLVDPQNDAHLMVIGERTADGADANLNAFAAAVRQNLLTQNPSARFIDLNPLYGVYYDGILLKLSSDVDGVPLEYLIGLYTIKNYAFQVIGFTHKDEFASVKPDFIDAIKSFYFDIKTQQKMDRLQQQPFADKVQ